MLYHNSLVQVAKEKRFPWERQPGNLTLIQRERGGHHTSRPDRGDGIVDHPNNEHSTGRSSVPRRLFSAPFESLSHIPLLLFRKIRGYGLKVCVGGKEALFCPRFFCVRSGAQVDNEYVFAQL